MCRPGVRAPDFSTNSTKLLADNGNHFSLECLSLGENVAKKEMTTIEEVASVDNSRPVSLLLSVSSRFTFVDNAERGPAVGGLAIETNLVQIRDRVCTSRCPEQLNRCFVEGTRRQAASSKSCLDILER